MWQTDFAFPPSINPIDIGVRVEVPASVMEPLTRVTYEAKLHFNPRNSMIRFALFACAPMEK